MDEAASRGGNLTEIEKLIDRLAKHDGVWCSQPTGYELVAEAAAALEQLQIENEKLKAQVPRWIPVEERLPEKSGEYLIFTDEKEIYAMEFDEDVGDKGEFGWWTQKYSNGGWAGSDWATAEDITHWMPLPKPPKEAAYD